MSFYFRDWPKFGDRLRGKSGDELLEEIKQQFDEESKSFFEPTNRSGRDPFERRSTFSRAFPFDDDNFGRRSDIRAHLDDLAARHPELAEHLLGPPWSDVPFHGSFRSRNRANDNYSGNDNAQQQQQTHADEDARSQASGSSAGSSYEEPDNRNQQEREEQDKNRKIPQYGLRNTVDIGQHRHNMENPDKGNRSQRSMSAPPENRQSGNQQQTQQQQESAQPQQGQRYVSRIDITPQHNQPQQQQQPSQQQQKPQQQSNVRHIPIFVEGRDEPVLPRSFAEEVPHFRREPSPTQFGTPPHFPRHDSPFGSRFGGRHHQWPPHFQDSFYPASSTFEHPSRKQQQQHYEQPRQQPKQTQQHHEQPRQQWQQKPEQKPAEQQQQEAPPPKPKPTLPKDPLERVALVQKEVDSLAEQVKQYTGNSRTDKQYIYLDEMLTRELIKLDDIETEGRENVRQARKNAIRTIQETISLLESKAPLASRQTSMEEQERCEDQEEKSKTEEEAPPEAMDVDQKSEGQDKEAMPLPPSPSSPTKPSGENEQSSAEKAAEGTEQQQQEEPMVTGTTQETSSIEKPSLEQTNLTEEKENAERKEDVIPEETNSEKAKNVSEEIKPENVSNETEAEAKTEKIEDTQKPEEKMDVDSSEVKQPPKSPKTPKSPKKGKKTKKQTPVSDTPIPLPPPDNAEANAK